MALPSTGPISLNDVNVELEKSPSALISLNDAAVRSLAEVASGIISMQNLRGKSFRICRVVNYFYDGSNPPRCVISYTNCNGVIQNINLTGVNGQQGSQGGATCMDTNKPINVTLGSHTTISSTVCS